MKRPGEHDGSILAMPGDLLGGIGGLRIANPDDSDDPPSATDPDASIAAAALPPPSVSSSEGTITDPRRSSNTLASSASHDSSQYSIDRDAPSRRISPSLSQPADATYRRLSHRQSMPLGYQDQQTMQYPAHSSNYRQQIRQPPSQSNSPRPISGMYMQPNSSTSSTRSGDAPYHYRADAFSMDGSGAGVARSGSRSARGVIGAALGRQGSRSYGSGGPPSSGGNGPLPPRRNSRRTAAPEAGSSPVYAGPLDGQYATSAALPVSAEEWQDRGAATTVQREVDASGQTHSRVVKKGVKDFNFGRTLGEGSYSTVMAATDRQNLKEYAIKVLDKRHIIKEKKVKYVNIERDTLNRLTDHPGIVRLYYTFQDERSLYFVLDLASGGELLGVLKKMGSFDLECTKFYGAEILDSIAYMHSRGVIHRDLKPENVLLDRDMHVKITDFGTAKILPDPRPNGESNAGSSKPGNLADGAETDRAVSFVGTAEYVSPELLRDKNACKASDLWAFGCIIYQLLAGRPPFKAANEYLTFQKILVLDYSFPDGFPDVARDLVERLLVLEPLNRLPVEHVRNHEFFEGIQWGKSLWRQKAPRLKPYTAVPAEPMKLDGGTKANGSSAAILQQSATPPPILVNNVRSQLRGVTELPPPSQLDIDWSPVLTHNNERILKLGNLIVYTAPQPHSPTSKTSGDGGTPSEKPKFSRFFSGNASKRRERLVLITSAARVVIVPAGGNDKKAKMEVGLLGGICQWKSYVDSKGLTAWQIDTVRTDPLRIMLQ